MSFFFQNLLKYLFVKFSKVSEISEFMQLLFLSEDIISRIFEEWILNTQTSLNLIFKIN